MIPAGENLNPNKRNSNSVRGIRGKIETLSRGARTRLRNYLSMIRRDVDAWTMALTLPGIFDHLPPEKVHSLFKKLSSQFTAATRWRHVGLVYKRELQDRMALHYHLAFYGIKGELEAKELQAWLSSLWNRLCCDGMEDPDGKLREHHLWWHLRWNPKKDKESNMQPVRTSIASYFAKYLGKGVNVRGMVIPGKWWGKLNESVIPIAQEKSIQLPAPVRDKARRMASKLQAKRIQYGLFRGAMLKAKLVDEHGNPRMSLQQFHQARNPLPEHLGEQSPKLILLWVHQQMRKRLISEGYRSGSHNRPRISKFGKITLVGGTMPETAIRIMKHAASMWKYDRENHAPF